MYVGGTDERALHHLAAEALDNAMDEAVAGMQRESSSSLIRRDRSRCATTAAASGRSASALPEKVRARNHPDHAAFGGSSAAMPTRHRAAARSRHPSASTRSSDRLDVEVARAASCGGRAIAAACRRAGSRMRARADRRGTVLRFHPDPESLPTPRFDRRSSTAWRARRRICSAASRFAGAAILVPRPDGIPQEARLHFPNGLGDFLAASLATGRCDAKAVSRRAEFPDAGPGEQRRVAVVWPENEEDGFCHSYCNTIPTPEGGTHEAGLRQALTRASAPMAS